MLWTLPLLPKKPEIPVGTLRSILSQAHIDAQQWDKLAGE
jgi:hypothetical protein